MHCLERRRVGKPPLKLRYLPAPPFECWVFLMRPILCERRLQDRAYIQSRHRDFQDRAGNYRWWSHTASFLRHCVLRMSNLSSEKATPPSDRLVGGWSDLAYSRHSLGLRPEIYIRPN